jgi:hypothetical protein
MANILIKYDFPNSSAKTLEAILDAYGFTKQYEGFSKVFVTLAPGSDPVNWSGFGPALLLDTPRESTGQPYNPWLTTTTLTPNGGSAWSVLICLLEV